MIFKFKRKQFSDVVKVVEFLDKSQIEYEVITDIEVQVTRQVPSVPVGPVVPSVPVAPSVFTDPARRPAECTECNNEDWRCSNIVHYGGVAL